MRLSRESLRRGFPSTHKIRNGFAGTKAELTGGLTEKAPRSPHVCFYTVSTRSTALCPLAENTA